MIVKVKKNKKNKDNKPSYSVQLENITLLKLDLFGTICLCMECFCYFYNLFLLNLGLA